MQKLKKAKSVKIKSGTEWVKKAQSAYSHVCVNANVIIFFHF